MAFNDRRGLTRGSLPKRPATPFAELTGISPPPPPQKKWGRIHPTWVPVEAEAFLRAAHAGWRTRVRPLGP